MLFSVLAALIGPTLIPFAVMEPHGGIEACLVSLAGVLATVGAIAGIVAPRWRSVAFAGGALLAALVFVTSSSFVAGVEGTAAILFLAAGLQPGPRVVPIEAARQRA